MSSEQADQQRKQSSVLPPALSKFSSESVPEPALVRGLEGEDQVPPATNEPENPPEEKNEEHRERKESPSQPDTEPEPASEESKHDRSSGNETEHPQPAEPQPKEPPTLPRVLSQETLTQDLPSPTEEAEDHASIRAQPLSLMEQRHQQKKQPSHWPLK